MTNIPAEDERLNISRRRFFFFGSLFLAKPLEIVKPEPIFQAGDRLSIHFTTTTPGPFPGGFLEVLHFDGKRQKYPLNVKIPAGGRIVGVGYSTEPGPSPWVPIYLRYNTVATNPGSVTCKVVRA